MLCLILPPKRRPMLCTSILPRSHPHTVRSEIERRHHRTNHCPSRGRGRGMKGYSTNFSLIMLRNCSQLSILQLWVSILQLWVRLARSMGAFSSVLRVFT